MSSLRFLGAIAIALLGLPAYAAAQAPACVPGAQVECACPGGWKGVQQCDATGRRYLPCQCAAAAPAPAPPPAVPAMPPPPPPAFAPIAAPSADASLTGMTVSTTAPAAVAVQGADRGRAPLDVRNLPPGTYRVEVQFDDGGQVRRSVVVRAGAVTQVLIEPSSVQRAAVYRSGLKAGWGAGLAVVSLSDHPGPGVAGTYFENWGFGPRLEARVGGAIDLATIDKRGVAFLARVPGGVRFNLGGRYSLGAGASFGLRSAETHGGGPREYGILLGPEIVPFIFRLGERRDMEISVTAGYGFSIFSSASGADRPYDLIYSSVSFGYLFL